MRAVCACYAALRAENYLAYYHAAMRLVRTGGAICFGICFPPITDHRSDPPQKLRLMDQPVADGYPTGLDNVEHI